MKVSPEFYRFYNRYKIELFSLGIATVVAGSTGVFFSVNAGHLHRTQSSESGDIEIVSPAKATDRNQMYVVDVSGAVASPGIYEVSPTTRLLTVVEMAGGLSEHADSAYFYRNFNLARLLQDGEKIYIPFQSEIENGIFVEAPRVLRYMSATSEENSHGPVISGTSNNSAAPQSMLPATDTSLVSINTASPAELDKLPGVGAKTVEKIIQNRPYSSLEDLLHKKVLGQKLFETLQPQLSL